MNTELIPDLPFKFKSIEGYVWTATELFIKDDGWVMYLGVRDKDGFTLDISAVKMMMNLKSGDWEIVKEENKMKKIKPTDLKGFVANEHQPYTDYNQEIADWLTENAEVDLQTPLDYGGYIFTDEQGTFYGQKIIYSQDKYYTNEEFKEWIGMTKKLTTKEKLENVINNEGQRALDYLKEKYMNEMPKLVAGKHWVVVENEGYGGIGLVVGDGMLYYVENEEGQPCHGFDIIVDVSQYIVEVREIIKDNPPAFISAKVVFERVDEKQLAIQKELEFAKAKAERLAAHISVLESKLK